MTLVIEHARFDDEDADGESSSKTLGVYPWVRTRSEQEHKSPAAAGGTLGAVPLAFGPVVARPRHAVVQPRPRGPELTQRHAPLGRRARVQGPRFLGLLGVGAMMQTHV